jgi:trimethylamine--corrinoid protein Co-methyltransferase
MIHKASMDLFANKGIQVKSERALQAFHQAGADVDRKAMVVRASESWVMDRLRTAPSCVTLYGREERHDLVLDGTNVYIGTGGTALNVLDMDTGRRRPTSLRDVERASRLVDALDNIHFFVLSCYPNELEKSIVDVNRFYAGIRNTTKHVMGGVYTTEGVRNIAKMGAMIAGSREALVKKPFLSYITCIMSPLLMDRHYTDLMMDVIETGLPLATPTAPMSGTTAPATLAGTLVQMNVEALSGVLLAQIVNPGHPVLYSCVPTTMDLRTGAFCFGSVEMGMMNAASAQLSRFYDLPNYTTAGVNESKIPDVQSGYESMASSLMCALAGSNFIHDAAGLIESGMTISYEQYVIDNDILGMCMRAVKGIEVTEESLALDVIKSIGPGGHYLTHDHTLENMRSEFFYPLSADRQTFSGWTSDGSPDGRTKAGQIARSLLAMHRPKPVDVEAGILSGIPGMVQDWMD